MKISAYMRLMRLHQPVGIYLVLWPALIALFDAANGTPHIKQVLIFILGAILARSAGCVINDLWDQDIDNKVTRTKNRPITTGEVTKKQALLLMLVLFTICAWLAWIIIPTAFYIALIAFPLIILYPLAKRITGHPQAVLALTFSMGIPMGYAAWGKLGIEIWLPLMLANMAWIYAYDTIYAMADKDDDQYLDIGSSALSWGRYDTIAVGLFQALTIVFLYLWWSSNIQGIATLVAIVICISGFACQHLYIRKRTSIKCINAFKSNHWLQAIIFAALLFDKLVTI